MKKVMMIILLVFFLTGCFQGLSIQEVPLPVEKGVVEEVQVLEVIDGDTVKLSDGRRVRYIGIDTPETVDPHRTDECYGLEASLRNKELVEGKMVQLEMDKEDKDDFGRSLRYVWMDDILVNEVLVKEGYARAKKYPPNVKYHSMLLSAQKEAKVQDLGLWGTCQE